MYHSYRDSHYDLVNGNCDFSYRYDLFLAYLLFRI